MDWISVSSYRTFPVSWRVGNLDWPWSAVWGSSRRWVTPITLPQCGMKNNCTELANTWSLWNNQPLSWRSETLWDVSSAQRNFRYWSGNKNIQHGVTSHYRIRTVYSLHVPGMMCNIYFCGADIRFQWARKFFFVAGDTHWATKQFNLNAYINTQ